MTKTKENTRVETANQILNGFVPETDADLEPLNGSELVSIYNRLADTHGFDTVKRFADRKSATKRLLSKFAEFGGLKKAKKTTSKKSGPTKYDLLRSAFTNLKPGETVTMEQLIAISGFDRKNVSVAMSILRNEARTNNPVFTTYDKDEKRFVYQK